MHSVHHTPVVTATSSATADIVSDLLVIPVCEDDDLGDEPGLDVAARGEIALARARGEFRGRPYEVLGISTQAASWKTARAVLVGVGKRADVTADRLRRVAIVGGLAARQRRLPRLAVVHRPGARVTRTEAAQALAEGVTIANFEGASLKTEGQPPVWLTHVALRFPDAAGAGDTGDTTHAIARGVVLGECTNVARQLANEPGNHLPPRVFAERASALAVAAGLAVEVLDEARLAALGMGLLLGVAKGSQEPPRLLVMRHEPKNAAPGVTLGFVGKGITFDTGGISIKPADNMDKMKDDMAGGAAVIGAMAAIARLGVPVRCVGIVPMSENMPGGRAMKPGDVLTSAAGKTVEILNTDAEGRLVLGDAVWYAREQGATHLVDVATLTGACVVALGKTTTGLFGSPDTWVDQVRRASERAGDRSWPMPVFEDYRDLFKSEIADFANTGGRAGGAITAALFIKEFVGEIPWVHMDIAGTAWAEDAKPYQPKGATGVAVRTLAELAIATASTAVAGGR